MNTQSNVSDSATGTDQPWEVIRRAADRVVELANVGVPGPWQAGERCVWAINTALDPIVDDGSEGDGGCLNVEVAQWIATMSPAVAEPLVAWLRDAQREFHFTPPHRRNFSWDHALAFARQVLGSADPEGSPT